MGQFYEGEPVLYPLWAHTSGTNLSSNACPPGPIFIPTGAEPYFEASALSEEEFLRLIWMARRIDVRVNSYVEYNRSGGESGNVSIDHTYSLQPSNYPDDDIFDRVRRRPNNEAYNDTDSISGRITLNANLNIGFANIFNSYTFSKAIINEEDKGFVINGTGGRISIAASSDIAAGLNCSAAIDLWRPSSFPSTFNFYNSFLERSGIKIPVIGGINPGSRINYSFSNPSPETFRLDFDGVGLNPANNITGFAEMSIVDVELYQQAP